MFFIPIILDSEATLLRSLGVTSFELVLSTNFLELVLDMIVNRVSSELIRLV